VLKEICHALCARCFMGKSSRRTLVLGPGYFPAPYGDAVAHAARRKLEPKIRPIGCVRRVVEARLAVEGVEISADELAVFHADAGIIDEIGHAAGGIDLIVGLPVVRVFASMISTRSSSAFSMTMMRARRAYGEPYVT